MLKYKLFLILCCCSYFGFSQNWDLQRCLDYALANNISIKQADLQVESSQKDQIQAKASFLPSLNANASHGYNWGKRIDPFTNTFAAQRVRSNNLGVSSNLLLFNGFNRVNSLKLANLNYEAQSSNAEKMINDISLNVVNSYLNVLFNKEFVTIAESNLNATTEQADRIKKLVDAGQNPRGDYLNILSQLATDESSQVSAQNNLTLALISLRQLLQLPIEEAPNFDIVKPEVGNLEDMMMAADPSGALINALNNFPEIRAAETNVWASQMGTKLAGSGFYPSLSASFNFGTGYSGLNQEAVGESSLIQVPIGVVQGTEQPVLTQQVVFDDFRTTPFASQLDENINRSLFISLQIPIFNGLSTRTNYQKAKISELQAEFTLQNTKNALTQEIERAYADAKAAYQNYLASQKALEAGQEAFKYAKIQYEAGTSTVVEYAQSRARLDNAKAGLVQNRYDYLFKLKVIDFYQGKPIKFN